MSESPLPAPPVAAADEAPFVPPRWRWVRKHPTLIVGSGNGNGWWKFTHRKYGGHEDI